MRLILALSALFAFANAECPGDGSPCSGHGSCGAWDKCQCYRNWQGPGCSDRTCPFQTSWNEIASITLSTGTAYEHKYTECSSKGECNRKTGECECFDGFTGSACRRMMCDGDGSCGGHGVCKTLKTVQSAYTGWDEEKIQVCACDPGYEGDSCEKRICPHGDDPITTTSLDGGTYNAQTNDIQTITIGTAADDATKQFFLRYTDYRGQAWDTFVIDAYTPTAIEIEEALEALPNNAIPSVTVTGSVDGSNVGSFEVTFDHHSNAGLQPKLQVIADACTASGCQPKSNGVAAWSGANSGNNAAVAHKAHATGFTNEEFLSCSQRGICDTESGDCQCFKGYTGQACETQTIIV